MNETAPVRQPVRRVGTFTMGLALLITGVVLVIWMFRPGAWIRWVLQFSPLLLVALGAELLIANATAKGRKLKYDLLSIFVCMVVIAGAAAGTAGVMYLDYEQNALNWRSDLLDELHSECRDALEKLPIADVDISYAQEDFWEVRPTLEQAKSSSRLYMFISLSGAYDDEAFVTQTQKVAKALNNAGLRPQHYIVQGRQAEGTENFRLELNGDYAPGLSKKELLLMLPS